MQAVVALTRPRYVWLWVTGGYIFQAIPAAIRDEALPIALKNTGSADALITKVVASLGLILGVKILLAPLISLFAPKSFILWTQFLITAVLAFLGWNIGGTLPSLGLILGGLMLVSFLAASHDYALDGYFVGSLNDQSRANYSGLVNFASKFGGVLCGPALIWLAGTLMSHGASPHQAWSNAVYFAAAIALLAVILNFISFRQEPSTPTDHLTVAERSKQMREGLTDLLRDPRLGAVLGLIFFYRASEIHMARILPLFSMAPTAAGGLALSNESYAILRLWTAVGGLALGGLVGSLVVGLYGLRSSLVPLGIVMHLPLLLIAWLAYHPGQPALIIGIVFFLEYLAYGAGLCALLLSMMKVAAGPSAAVRYAALSTFALLANYLPGLWAGTLATQFGYAHYFTGALLLSIPGIWVSFRARRHFEAA